MIVNATSSKRITLGRLGENETRIVRFNIGDIKADFPGAEFMVLNRRPTESAAYPVSLNYIAESKNHLDWTIQSGDLLYQGLGECQLIATVDDKIAKSQIYLTEVLKALDGSGNPPAPWASWVQGVKDDADRAEAAAAAAASAAVHGPEIIDGEWYVWDEEEGDYIGTGISAEGEPGQPGHTPELTASKSGKTTTIYADGTQLAQIQDGQDGQGADVIDDTAPAADKTYSSNKVEAELTPVKNALTSIDEEVNGEKIQSINLFNPNDSDILDNKYIDGSTGQETSYNGIMETGFIACEPGDTFTFYNSEGYLSGYKHIAYYNAQKQFVSGSTGIALPTITIPSGNIAYFRIALTKNKLTGQMIVKNDSEIHDYVPYGYTMSGGINASVYPWKDKAVVCFGDSIMFNDGHNGINGYPYYMQECGFETITNKGENGACIAYHSERSSYKDICTSVDEVTFTGYDLVVIEGGINDYLASSASPIGALVNSTNASDFDKTTFIGALQYVITTILNAKATIKIVLFTPLKKVSWFNENSQGKTLIDYVAAMKQVAEYYSIPVLDYFSISGLNRKNLSTFTSDGLHPNNDGYKFICENKLPAFINSMLTGAGASDKIDKPAAPSSGDFLVFNGTTWVAQSLSTWQGGNY